MAKVLVYGRGKFEAGSSRLLRIKLKNPLLLTAGDPFVLRQVSPPATLGGGRVLDASPVPGLRKIKIMEWLENLRSATHEEQIALLVARRGAEGLSLQRLMAETGLARQAADRRLQPLVLSQRLLQITDEILLESQALEVASEAISSVLQQYVSGVKRSEIKTRAALRPEILDFALQTSCRRGETTVGRRAGSSGPSRQTSVCP